MFGMATPRPPARDPKSATLEDGLAYFSGQLEDLARLERRLARLESSVCGEGVKPVEDMPVMRDAAPAGAAPRLMAYVFALAAVSAKLHARAEHLERTVGRPTTLPAETAQEGVEPAAAPPPQEPAPKGPRWEPAVAVSNKG